MISPALFDNVKKVIYQIAQKWGEMKLTEAEKILRKRFVEHTFLSYRFVSQEEWDLVWESLKQKLINSQSSNKKK